MRRHSRGQAVLEVALVLPVFILLALAVVEGAGYAFAATTLQNAAQQGARLAALPTTVSETAVKERVIDQARPVQLAATDVTLSVNGGATTFLLRSSGDRVRVSIRLDYRPLTAQVFGAGAIFALAADAEYNVE